MSSNAPEGRPDLVIADARLRVHALAPEMRGALLVSRGRVLGTSPSAPSRSELPADARVVAAGGRVVTPAFIDAHTHLESWARTRLRPSFSAATTLAAVGERLAAAHRAHPGGAWLVGEDVEPLVVFDAAPHRELLDAHAPGRAVVLRTHDRHSMWLSSSALAAAGIGRTTTDPPGGRIGRDANGEPDGILYEEASSLVLPFVAADDEAAITAELGRVFDDLLKLGITGVHDFGTRSAWGRYAALDAAGRLPVRVAFGWMRDEPTAEALARKEPGARLRTFALKEFADGTLGSRTAHMLAPFDDDPSCGLPTLGAEDLDRAGERARALGVTLAVHAIGDAAVRSVLDAFERWPADARARLRPRVEHAQLVDPADVPRFASLGVIASMQPVHAPSDRPLARRSWGARDDAGGYAWGVLERAGARLAFGSDVPIEPPDPRAGLFAVVTGADPGAARCGHVPRRALPLARAIDAFTRGAAYAAHEEAHAGSLEPGRAADFLVWDADPWGAGDHSLPGLPIASTWTGGKRADGGDPDRVV